MKILHYIPTIDLSAGGTTSSIRLLANELGKLVELHVVTQPSFSPCEIENCTLHLLESKLIWKMKKNWMAILTLVHPDLVHIHCCWFPSCALTQRWAQEMGYKVILTPRGMLEPWIIKRNYWKKKLPALLLYQRQAIRKADVLHATAESEKANLLKLGYNHKIEVIANGIDVDHIDIRNNWELRKQVLFLSRIHVKKGIEILLDAVALLKNELQDYSVIIAGEGNPSYLASLLRRTDRLGILKIVKFIGGVNFDSKWNLFKSSDIFVLPSYSENFGNVIIEALSVGVPVITTTGTPWMELNEKKCGWCIELTVENLSATLAEALKKDKDELKKMGLNGRGLVEQKYNISALSYQMKNFYETLINCEYGNTTQYV